MKKINFVNGTTINGAETFNEMQDNVEKVFNGEEAMGSIVVEGIECKNILNFKNSNYWGILNTSSEVIFPNTLAVNTAINEATRFYKRISIGTTLTLSARINSGIENFESGWVQIGISLNYSDGTNEPKTMNLHSSNKDTIQQLTFTTEKEVESIDTMNGGNLTITGSTSVVVGLQLEKGTTATNYMPYENFEGRTDIITNNECPTNEYIDGERVYCYKYNLTSPTILDEDIEIADLPSDFKKLRRVECMFYFGSYQVPAHGGANGFVFVNSNKLQMSISNQAYCGRPVEIIIYYVKN